MTSHLLDSKRQLRPESALAIELILSMTLFSIALIWAQKSTSRKHYGWPL